MGTMGRVVALLCAWGLVALAGCSEDCPTCPCSTDVGPGGADGIEADGLGTQDTPIIHAGGDEGDAVAADDGASVDDLADATDPGPPPAPVCGDGVVEGTEQCDLGEANGPDSSCLINCANNPVVHMPLGSQYVGTYEGMPAAEAATDDSSAYVGEGCWATTPGVDTNGDGEQKFELFLDPNVEEAKELGPFTVDDIANVFYASRKPAEEPWNFYLVIYTKADGVDDGASWYGYRLTGQPAYARNVDAVPGEWALWSTQAGPNQLTFYDSNKLHTFGVASGQPTLSELQASEAFDWSTVHAGGDVTAIDYGAESVKYLSIQTATNWAADFHGQIDYVGLELRDGRGVVFDLEP